jgi:hypothetical protein
MVRSSEIKRGCIFSEDFNSVYSIVKNGGTIVGSPTFDQSRGMRFNGSTNYITYASNVQPWSTGFCSCVVEFTPAFDGIPAATQVFFDTVTGTRCMIQIAASSGNLSVLFQTTLLTLAPAAYQPYWRLNQRNVLVVSSRSGATTAWLNGVQLGTSVTTWTAGTIGTLVVARDRTSTYRWTGYIRSIKFFRGSVAADLLTVQEAIDYTNGSTFNYMSKAVCIAPMTADTYDPTNTRILDVSGRGNHLNYTVGATAPTKLATRGFSIDGGDYFSKFSFGLTSMTQGFTLAGVALTAGVAAVVNRAICTLRRTDNGLRAVYLAHMIGLTTFSIVHNNAGSSINTGALIPFGTWYSWAWSFAAGLAGSQLFINGRAVYTGGALTAPNGYDGGLFLGSDLNAGEIGGLKYFALWPFRFSQLQALDYHASVMGDLNRV